MTKEQITEQLFLNAKDHFTKNKIFREKLEITFTLL